MTQVILGCIKSIFILILRLISSTCLNTKYDLNFKSQKKVLSYIAYNEWHLTIGYISSIFLVFEVRNWS